MTGKVKVENMKVGDRVVFWDNGVGHVIFVEAVYVGADGQIHVITSESNGIGNTGQVAIIDWSGQSGLDMLLGSNGAVLVKK